MFLKNVSKTFQNFAYNDGKPGPWCEKLYHKLRAIQYGEEPDTHGWMTVL